MRRSRTTLAVGLVLAGLMGLRAAFVGVTAADPVFRVPYLDSAFYHVWARSLAEGQGDFRGPYFMGPLFPHALRWVYEVFGPDVFAARVAQTLLGCGEIVLLAWIGSRLFGTLAGMLGASLFALYSTRVFYEGVLTMEVLLSVLTTAAFAVLVTCRGALAWRAPVCGVLLGLAGLGRGTALLLVPVACVLVLRMPARRRRNAWLLVVACVLVLTPTLVRNARLVAGPVLTTNAGVNFYAGNAPGANGRFKEPPGVRFFTTAGAIAPAQHALPSGVAARALTVGSVAGTPAAADSRLWFGRSWEWIRSEPLAFGALLVLKVFLMLQSREIAQIESVEFHKQRIRLLAWFCVDLAWILPLAVLGAWTARKQAQAHAALAFAVTLLLPCVIFFVTTRYRLNAVPFLALLAGCGAAYLVRAIATRRYAAAGVALAAVVGMALLTRVGAQPPATSAGWENAQMAERVYALGDLDAAIAYQEAAARLAPNRLEVQMNLALYWSERKHGDDLTRAAQLLEASVRRWPNEALLHFNLGTVYEAQQRAEDAGHAYERALRLDPNLTPARRALEALRPSRSP